MTGTETFHEVCGSFLHCFQLELEFRMLVFVKGGKEVPGEKHSGQGREPATNSTHMWRQFWESNSGHSGGNRTRATLSLL